MNDVSFYDPSIMALPPLLLQTWYDFRGQGLIILQVPSVPPTCSLSSSCRRVGVLAEQLQSEQPAESGPPRLVCTPQMEGWPAAGILCVLGTKASVSRGPFNSLLPQSNGLWSGLLLGISAHAAQCHHAVLDTALSCVPRCCPYDKKGFFALVHLR